MRIEGHDHDGQSPLGRDCGGARDDALMAAMDSVEHADRDDGRPPGTGHVIQALPPLHGAASPSVI
jgi:hypothetical protein